MEPKLIRIRELIDQKEAIDNELATLIGDAPQAPRRGRPRRGEGLRSGGAPATAPPGDSAE
jgi:hypothetical protein